MPRLPDLIVRDYRPDDRDAATRVMTRAFLDFPPMQAIVGTDGQAGKRLAHFMRAMLFAPEPTVTIMVAEAQSRLVGALTYVDAPRCQSMSAGQMLAFIRTARHRLLWSVPALIKTQRIHPRTPHRHLPAIGVDPDVWGCGIGGLLMAEFTRRCDADGLDGYLETVRYADPRQPSHRALYERHGFRVTHEVPMTPRWSMLGMLRPHA